MRSTIKSVAVVLAFALSLSVTAPAVVHAQPTAAISGHQIEPPDFTSFLNHFIKQLKHFFGSSSNGDSLTVPRP